MWGFEPSNAAILTKEFFISQNIKTVLIPGIRYRRNAQVFLENETNLSGIEISQTAIDIANNKYKNAIKIYQDSVTEMPFEGTIYDGIFW
jgi:hypothetical protein